MSIRERTTLTGQGHFNINTIHPSLQNFVKILNFCYLYEYEYEYE